MALKNLPFKPGFYADDTDRDVGGLNYWKGGDKVRFVDGHPQKMGGWATWGETQMSGVARIAVDWQAIDSSERLIAVGTNRKLYLFSGALWYDITPYRDSGTLTDPFSTTNTSAVVDVADTAHGVLAGDYVTFSGASAVGGITISGEYTVTSVTNANAYKITHSSAATSTAGPGGGSVTYGYQISPGPVNTTVDVGWGAGTWGAGTWGTPRSVSDLVTLLRLWSLDTWGQDLIACPRDGGIYAWTYSAGVGSPATLLTNAPATAKFILVSTEDRHLIALGAHDGVADDPMLVRWCSQGDYTTWVPALTNTAGDKRLDEGSEIVGAVKARNEHLIYTNSTLYSMQFVGPPYTFSIRSLGDNGGVVGPNAMHVYEGVTYWMGAKEFYYYDGVIRVLECSVNEAVFAEMDVLQGAKVWAGGNRAFNEVWWLYPSSSGELDRYAIYNTLLKCWYTGSLERTVLVGDSDVYDGPYGIDTNGQLYTHEVGSDANGTAIEAYVESGDIELDSDGNQMQHLSKYIPDFKRLVGSVDVTFTGKRYPQDSETQTSGPHTISSSTPFVNPRMRCRQISIKLESTDQGDAWRTGVLRVDVLPHGGR